MGYPMTWQRLIHRNGITPDFPMQWDANVNTSEQHDTIANLSRIRAERLERLAKQGASLQADVARLVIDAQDEQALCRHIAERALIPPDVVAAVLKEFFAL